MAHHGLWNAAGLPVRTPAEINAAASEVATSDIKAIAKPVDASHRTSEMDPAAVPLPPDIQITEPTPQPSPTRRTSVNFLKGTLSGIAADSDAGAIEVDDVNPAIEVPSRQSIGDVCLDSTGHPSLPTATWRSQPKHGWLAYDRQTWYRNHLAASGSRVYAWLPEKKMGYTIEGSKSEIQTLTPFSALVLSRNLEHIQTVVHVFDLDTVSEITKDGARQFSFKIRQGAHKGTHVFWASSKRERDAWVDILSYAIKIMHRMTGPQQYVSIDLVAEIAQEAMHLTPFRLASMSLGALQNSLAEEIKKQGALESTSVRDQVRNQWEDMMLRPKDHKEFLELQLQHAESVLRVREEARTDAIRDVVQAHERYLVTQHTIADLKSRLSGTTPPGTLRDVATWSPRTETDPTAAAPTSTGTLSRKLRSIPPQLTSLFSKFAIKDNGEVGPPVPPKDDEKTPKVERRRSFLPGTWGRKDRDASESDGADEGSVPFDARSRTRSSRFSDFMPRRSGSGHDVEKENHPHGSFSWGMPAVSGKGSAPVGNFSQDKTDQGDFESTGAEFEPITTIRTIAEEEDGSQLRAENGEDQVQEAGMRLANGRHAV